MENLVSHLGPIVGGMSILEKKHNVVCWTLSEPRHKHNSKLVNSDTQGAAGGGARSGLN